MTVAAIGYLRIGSRDTAALMEFGCAVLGLMDAARDDSSGARFLRMDQHPFRFMLEAGDQDRLLAIGLEARSAGDWQASCDRLAAAGHMLTAGTEAEAARRCVSAFVCVQDPSGNTVELYHGRKLDYRPFNSPVGIPRFVTRSSGAIDMGFGHAVIPAPAIEQTTAFYTDLIGLGVCDTLHLRMPPSRVIFMHADNPRQHSLALYDQPHPVGVVHVMVEVENLDQVGMALDRAKRAGHPVIASLGRHVNDEMCSFYVLGPGGIAFEYGYDGLQVQDWARYTPTVSTEGDLWGHEYNFPGVND
ncbi:MAG: VOC family protein [Halioglobus sp.]|nr:VOC family protein [Halioglobus sp.]